MASATNPHLSASLQIPSMESSPGPSRQNNYAAPSPQSAAAASSNSRPISVAAHTTAAASQNPPSASAAARRQRASHSVVSPSNTQQQQGSYSSHDDTTPPYTDVFAHPAAVAYAAAHPRRTIPKFGPYLLLQTLGEGEFGKVKLGLHSQWGEEVAVKLIRRGNVDTSVRLSKVEREIEVLKTLKHPNIVRLYDVIETDKYIGIILEYASGGELFDHILAHRYLREKDAAKLFSQLISGVWYIHQKKIVHRDLKLENLLLDRHRNVIITDFGFANRFEHRADDLMQTSCGSPCYAAPELVISEGLYVGSAVDIWSCGVILYAMLAGYLPFDDDPANPDGDNINLLYKYIVSTPLSFPEYISVEARDLLSMMLVPDPSRRTTLDGVMRHPWLSVYNNTRTDGIPNAFGKTVDELERAAMDQHQQKRLAYQRQMRQHAATNGTLSPSRTQSHRPEHGAVPSSASRSRSTQPEYLYDSSVDQSMASPATIAGTPTHTNTRKTYGSPSALGLSEDDPFAGPGGSVNANAASSTATSSKAHAPDAMATLSPNAQSPKGHKANSSSGGGSGFRHTIQVEYDDPSKASKKSDDRRRERSGSQSQSKDVPPQPQQPQHRQQVQPSTTQAHSKQAPPYLRPPTLRRRRDGHPKAMALNLFLLPLRALLLPLLRHRLIARHQPNHLAEPSLWLPGSLPSSTFSGSQEPTDKDKDSGSQNSTSSFKHGHKKGKSSLDRIGLSKIFGSGFGGNGSTSTPTSATTHTTHYPLCHLMGQGKQEEYVDRDGRAFSRSIRNRTKGRMTSTPLTADGASAANASLLAKPSVSPHPKTAALPPTPAAVPPDSAFSPTNEFGDVSGLQASTTKARKVMQWFRTKSKGRDSIGFGTEKERHRRNKKAARLHKADTAKAFLLLPAPSTRRQPH
ncbi:hypothetical protein BJ912DRAFT_937500, partial [Pholiota molesta]